ncbi:C-type lectin domain family 14 member A, partial [Pempheris klunzingeri]|uniref:C-type lectin domain family 14 member A n=1 Tax=Pempheris klunzingeri TaxID=3127111 RepID=UPI00397F4E19
NISAGSLSPHFTIHRTRVSFDRAMQDCSPGVLTTLATDQEVTNILGLVSESLSPLNQKEVTLWVGLRKVKDECVVYTLPLRGFKWTEDGSQESQVSRWAQEPKQTCTTVRCAALKVEFDGSAMVRWGLIPVTCKNSYQFICKMPPGKSETRVTPEPEPPATSKAKPATSEPPKTEPGPATQRPEPTTPEPERPIRGRKPGTEPTSETGPELQGLDPDLHSGPAPGSDSCKHPRIPGSRSLKLDPDDRIQVECWSSVLLELRCSGHPAAWRLPDNSPANFSTICQPCDDGFHKDASGNCVDINECGGGGAPCRHTCLNTEGSYRCVCSDEDGKHHDEDSPVCRDTPTDADGGGLLSDILIPVLVSVAVLVVLMVVVMVTVKCCLMRRSKRRAMKKAEKMAMKSKDSKDSFETANEKVEI